MVNTVSPVSRKRKMSIEENSPYVAHAKKFSRLGLKNQSPNQILAFAKSPQSLAEENRQLRQELLAMKVKLNIAEADNFGLNIRFRKLTSSQAGLDNEIEMLKSKLTENERALNQLRIYLAPKLNVLEFEEEISKTLVDSPRTPESHSINPRINRVKADLTEEVKVNRKLSFLETDDTQNKLATLSKSAGIFKATPRSVTRLADDHTEYSADSENKELVESRKSDSYAWCRGSTSLSDQWQSLDDKGTSSDDEDYPVINPSQRY